MAAQPMTNVKRQRSIADMFGFKTSTSSSDSSQSNLNKKANSNSTTPQSKNSNIKTKNHLSSTPTLNKLNRISYHKIDKIDPESYFESLSDEFKKLLELEFDVKSGLGRSYLMVLKRQLTQSYFLNLKQFLINEGLGRPNSDIYPSAHNIYFWSRITPLDQVKVVIIGQDPYHGPGQAHGLSFSVPKGIAIPGSLRNIHDELRREYPEFKKPAHGSLVSWARAGVLLLNTSLTVKKAQAGSHSNKGWEEFTDSIVEAIDLYGGLGLLESKQDSLEHDAPCEKKIKLTNDENATLKEEVAVAESKPEVVQPGFGKGVVFLCWGKWAADRVGKLSATKHLILKSAHPSPLSAHRGFLGNDHFKKANDWLETKYGPHAKIDWCDLKPDEK